MNYEQKYKEAIEKATALYNVAEPMSTCNVLLETIFPELKENEGERIRKEILEYFRQFDNEKLRGVDISDWIAWLEKQDRKDSQRDEEQKETLCDKCRREQPYHSCQDISELGRCALEHQSKQTSAWSEEDKLNYEQAIYVCHQNGYTAVENWLKSLKPQSHWKPTKEQIKAFEHFVRSIGESGYASPYDNNTKLIYSLLNDLKKL